MQNKSADDLPVGVPHKLAGTRKYLFLGFLAVIFPLITGVGYCDLGSQNKEFGVLVNVTGNNGTLVVRIGLWEEDHSYDAEETFHGDSSAIFKAFLWPGSVRYWVEIVTQPEGQHCKPINGYRGAAGFASNKLETVDIRCYPALEPLPVTTIRIGYYYDYNILHWSRPEDWAASTNGSANSSADYNTESYTIYYANKSDGAEVSLQSPDRIEGISRNLSELIFPFQRPLESGKEYCFTVTQTKETLGESGMGNVICSTTPQSGPVVTEEVDVTEVVAGVEQVTVYWNHPSDWAELTSANYRTESYSLYYEIKEGGVDISSSNEIAGILPDQTSYTVRDLEARVEYCFAVTQWKETLGQSEMGIQLCTRPLAFVVIDDIGGGSSSSGGGYVPPW